MITLKILLMNKALSVASDLAVLSRYPKADQNYHLLHFKMTNRRFTMSLKYCDSIENFVCGAPWE